jgi:hypothetical protein
VAFSGGPGGINHPPSAAEQAANHDQHLGATSFQNSHMNSAMNNKASYAHNNGGHPQNLAVSRPLGAENHNAPAGFNNRGSLNGNGNVNANAGVRTNNGGAAAYGNARGNEGVQTQQHGFNQPQHQMTQPMNQPRQNIEPRESPQSHVSPEFRTAPQPRIQSAPQPRMAPAPQPHVAQPHAEGGGGHEHGHGR